MDYEGLLLNIALLITVSLLYGYFYGFMNFSCRRNRVIIGFSFGLIAILVMLVPVQPRPGVIYDARSIVISLVGLFSGGLAVIVAGAMAALFRIWLGGIGVFASISTIVASALIGVIAHRNFKSKPYFQNPILLYVFGFVVTIAMLISQLLLPGSIALDLLREIWLPVLVIYPLGTVVMGLIIAEQEHRIRITRAMRESEERYRSLFENNHVAILLIDPETEEIVDANQAASEFYGWSREELRQIRVSDINMLSSDAVKEELKRSRESKRSYYEFKHRLTNGDVVDVAVYTGAIQIDGRKLLYSHIFDISQRKKAQKNLKEREQNLRITLDSIGDAVITTDAEGRVTRMNPVAEKLTAWEKNEAIGEPLEDVFNIIHAQTRESVENPVKKVIETGKTQGLANHTMLIARDGAEYQIADSGAPIVDLEGNISGVVMVFRDVTEEYEKEQILRESEEKFRTAFKTSPDSVNLNRLADGMYLEINGGFTDIMGYTPEDVLGKTSLELNIWKNSEDRKRLVSELREKGVVKNLEAEFLSKNGETKIGLMSANIIRINNEQVILSVTRDITDLKGVEERFRNIWQSTKDGMRLTDKDGTITRVNPAFCEIFGLPKTKIEGHPLSVLYKEDKDHILKMHSERFRAKTNPETVNSKFVLHNGETRWFDVSNSYVHIPGEPEQVLATFRDITEQKEAELALEESRARQTRIAQSIPGVLYDYIRDDDGNNQFLYISPDCMDIFEHPAEAIIEDSALLWDTVHPEDRRRLEVEDEQANKYGEIFQSEVRILTPSGKRKWIQLSSQPQPSEEGGEQVWSGVILDITNLKETEEALLESEHKFRVLMETAPDLIITHDMDGIVQYANPQVYAVLGYKPGFLLGKSVFEFVPPDEKMDFNTRKTDRFEGDYKIKLFESIAIDKSGNEIPLEVRTSPILWEGKPEQIMVIARDIRERLKLESRLRQAEKMDAIGHLAGGVAHDFNNKLTVILGQVNFALTSISETDPAYQMLEEVRQAAQDSADLTRQLLAFARKQITQPQILSLNNVVKNMLSMLRRLIGEDIELIWLPGKPLWNLKIDPVQVDQILANLIVNARDAIEGVGKITIETENIVLSDKRSEGYPEVTPGNYVQLSISDDGCGMEKDILDKVFEPFFTTKKMGKGTGLGLATVYGIVKQNKGFINVYSEPGVGTTFKIYFPPSEKNREHKRESTEPEQVHSGDETILLVEDDPAILKLGKMVLEGLGYTVLPSDTARQAIQYADDYHDRISLLVTDVIMPEMNGRDLAEKMKNQHPGLRVLFMSGYTANVIENQGTLDAEVFFLQKPFSREELALKVRKVLDQE